MHGSCGHDSRFIVLDSTPLGLLVQKVGYAAADDCRRWLAGHLSAGVRVFVPEIADYEVRRELLRLSKHAAIAELDHFATLEPDRYLPLRTIAIRRPTLGRRA